MRIALAPAAVVAGEAADPEERGVGEQRGCHGLQCQADARKLSAGGDLGQGPRFAARQLCDAKLDALEAKVAALEIGPT